MTRANIYLCDTFIASIGSDAYPNGELWNFLLDLNDKKCTQKEFEQAINNWVNEIENTKIKVGNWSYEFMWIPTEQPVKYFNWDNWGGIILVRTVNWKLSKGSYYQVPGKWVKIEKFTGVKLENLQKILEKTTSY